ncbi:anthranilate/aminodeoxychorismate synthase component II [Candidatus Peregrinibacteria bacterium RIFOXYB12_FULL_41_12]|nr:MAG: anthranilate/aminodeoxychorismate synthase component II [Candidatus Peregrinibacteria bacterium RIFOXYA2_FULL_41_18]OGJ49016.1 MAG: anthranilate/aminodeoxychorismate synthase component II [Candidatus Peregrinibacteria bacterium RIFOXYB12_FULL_41_12]OGJ53223.1 MAG: anthranilate/aminodeoxychorismate synthase component II [Candidatus Peregrinibacteria bacterium RIFOXYC2_FULL_41_22]OGJ54245.1 MAG: anthranilate/aminodeoxychorismate synthase component II [Candidatus Peregrinibacteria bacterium
MRLLLIDNYDSFTYNLYQQICRLGASVDVRKHDEISLSAVRDYDAIVISPGPKKPSDSGISCEVIAKFYDKKPILGVCLGHQCIGEVFGSKTVHAPKVMHGKTSSIFHNGHGIFHGVTNPFKAARYHSLVIDRVPEEFELTAWTRDKITMGIAHKKYPVHGVQFHPESFLTDSGDKIIRNFLHEIARNEN